jgi:hypothetical protein
VLVTFKIIVNGEPGAISSSGEFGDSVREGFGVVRRSIGPTVEYRLDVAYGTMTNQSRRVGSNRGSQLVLLLPHPALTK